ncbi:MAG: molecular chaperone HtpG [Desulfobulbaceae bacterium A2]|nr:MAG: molecular chaperone HtpG [Desulfobulbaceae bacterium A2]
MTTEQTSTHEFQAETRKVLDIVINSLYTEREIFLRELISNAADALEKFRHLRLTAEPDFDNHVPLEITIECDDKAHRLTVVDTGIGMSREELEKNLGTIAHSGSSRFLEELADAARQDLQLIGRFGVGFYAVFMAGGRVRVQSRPWDGGEGHEWESDGGGSYTIRPCPGLHRGTRVLIDLKEDAHDFAVKFTVERIVRQYSAFVPFPIKVEGNTINTVQALWTRNKSEISDDEYRDFYKFIGNAVDDPRYRLHFSADAPLAIHALLYVPQENFEQMGFGRSRPGVNLYCRKVLIEQHSEHILPEWLRFLKGIVDSEDLPLNISRQALQDSSLMAKLRRVLTKRVLRFLQEQADADASAYGGFWGVFGPFLKEGVVTDFEYREELGKLLRFQSSGAEEGELVSLADYRGRMNEGQEEIYYINGPSRSAIEQGPYVELFRQRGVEILYTLEPIDDFVLSHLGEFDGKKLVSADRADLKLPAGAAPAAVDDAETISGAAADALLGWAKDCLGERVHEVQPSSRLVASPAMIVSADGMMTGSMERVLKAARQDGGEVPGGVRKNLELNLASPLVRSIDRLRGADPELARDMIEQVFDSALIQSGALVDSQRMVSRNYRILERLAQPEAAA